MAELPVQEYAYFAIGAVLVLGSLLALGLAYLQRGPKRAGGIIKAGLLALGLAVLLMFVMGYVWDACHGAFRQCAGPDDKTVWYIVILPLLQLPLNWCLMLVFRKR